MPSYPIFFIFTYDHYVCNSFLFAANFLKKFSAFILFSFLPPDVVFIFHLFSFLNLLSLLLFFCFHFVFFLFLLFVYMF
jgi:hypothetical protein